MGDVKVSHGKRYASLDQPGISILSVFKIGVTCYKIFHEVMECPYCVAGHTQQTFPVDQFTERNIHGAMTVQKGSRY